MGNGMELTRDGEGFDRDTLTLLSGVALVIFGAGLILSNRTVRRYLGQTRSGGILEAAMPDIERYIKLRGM